MSFLFGDPGINYFIDTGVFTPGGMELKPLSPHLSSSVDDSMALGTAQSLESISWKNTPHKQDVSSVKSSTTNIKKESEDVAENVDGSTMYSTDTNFDSTMCVRNYSIHISKDILEKSAQAYSSLVQVPSFSDKGTVRKMAHTMAE